LVVGYKQTAKLQNPQHRRSQTLLIILESINTTENGQQTPIASVAVLHKCYQYLLQHLESFANEGRIAIAEREDIDGDFK
jgi:hypothetical protein